MSVQRWRRRHGFNPRPPGGGRPTRMLAQRRTTVSIHAPPEEGDIGAVGDHALYDDVSIHAPPEEGDCRQRDAWRRVAVSIHAPPEEGDRCTGRHRTLRYSFNPRPPGGGRPLTRCELRRACTCFNPRPPGGGRPVHAAGQRARPCFNPRPPGGGRRPRRRCIAWLQPSFNPRPPGGGRRQLHRPSASRHRVSIHAPPEEGDVAVTASRRSAMFQSTPPRRRATRHGVRLRAWSTSFNPRPPGGGRPRTHAMAHSRSMFQSTPPRRRATVTWPA